MLWEKVNGLEEDIKRDFIYPKLIIIEEAKPDYIDRIGAYY